MRYVRILFLALVIPASLAVAQDVVLTATPVNTVVDVGAPIQVRLEIRNPTKNNVLVGRTFELNYFIEMNITGPDGRATWCGTIPSRDTAPYTILRPSARISRVVTISCRNGIGYEMRIAGEYRVRASYVMPTPRVAFRHAVTSDVIIPRGPIVADAFVVTVKTPRIGKQVFSRERVR